MKVSTLGLFMYVRLQMPQELPLNIIYILTDFAYNNLNLPKKIAKKGAYEDTYT